MQFLLVLAILPIIFLLAWVAAPILWVAVRTIWFIEGLQDHFGELFSAGYMVLLAFLAGGGIGRDGDRRFLFALGVLVIFAAAVGKW